MPKDFECPLDKLNKEESVLIAAINNQIAHGEDELTKGRVRSAIKSYSYIQMAAIRSGREAQSGVCNKVQIITDVKRNSFLAKIVKHCEGTK